MSAPWPARRSIISIQLLTQLGLDLGLSLDRCLHETGLSPVQLASLNGEIEAQRELQLIANLIEALPAVSDLGLQAGRRYHLTTYGAWGYAILSSATVRQVSTGISALRRPWTNTTRAGDRPLARAVRM